MAMTARVLLITLVLAATSRAEEPVDSSSLMPPSVVSLAEIPWPADAPRDLGPVSVTVSLVIDVDGHVRVSEILQGAGAPFDAAVLRAAVLFRFTPAVWNGSPVEVAVPFTHTFVPPPDETEAPDLTLVSEIEGLVQERGTRAAVVGATIVVRAGERELLAMTDGEGKFTVRVPEGDLEVRVSSPLHRRYLQKESLAASQRVKVKYLLDRQTYSPYETVVVGRRERTEVSRTTLEGRELTRVPGTFGDPFRVVQVLPGVTQVMSLLPLPVVRGSSPGNTGIFLDQSRLPLLFHLFGGPSVVHPEFIDRVDFYPGGFPVKYGGYTGGIVDGQTRAAKLTEDRLDIDLNLVQSGVFWRHAFPSKELTTTVAGRIGYPGVMLSLVTDQMSLNYWDYQARVDQGGLYDGWTVFLYGASDAVEALQPDPDDETKETLQRMLLFRFHRGDFRLRRGDENRHLLARMVVGYDESGVGPTLTTGTAILNPMLRTELKLTEKLRWNSGLDAQVRRNFTALGTGEGESPIEPGDEAEGLLNENGWMFQGGLYTEFMWQPMERLLLVPGVRADYYQQQEAWQANVDPRVQGRLRLGEQGTWLKASVGLFHQPPRLFIPVPGLDISPLDLGLLSSLQSSVGAELRLAPGIELDVQTYFNWMDPVLFDLSVNQDPNDLLDRGPSSFPGQQPDDDERDNREDDLVKSLFAGRQGRSYGLEVMLRKRDADGLFGWISYTLSRSQRKDADGNWQSFDFDRTHILNLVAGLKLPRNWEIGGRLLVQTGTPISTLYGYNAGRTDPQMRVDLRIDKRAVWNEWLLDFYVDVINVVVASESGGIVGSDSFRYVLPTIGFRAVL